MTWGGEKLAIWGVEATIVHTLGWGLGMDEVSYGEARAYGIQRV